MQYITCDRINLINDNKPILILLLSTYDFSYCEQCVQHKVTVPHPINVKVVVVI